MNRQILTWLIVGIIGVWPLGSYGAMFIVQEDEALTTGAVNDDLYAVGNSVSVNHPVRDDLFSVANSVEVTETVGQDVFVAGNSVRIMGEVGDDVFAAGNSVRIMPTLAGDVFAAGSVIEIVSDNIEGSIYSAGQKITISGQIDGSVRVTGEVVRIKSGTKIAGDLITYGHNDPVIEGDVSVGGETRHQSESGRPTPAMTSQGLVLDWVISVVTWFVSAVVLLYLLPVFTNDVVKKAWHQSGRSLGVGFVWLLALMPVVIVLFMTIIGWPLAILTLVSSLTALIIASPLSMVVAGVWVMQKIQKAEMSIAWQHVLVGTVVMKIVQLVPLVGWLISLLVFILTLGALGTSLWERLRTKKDEPIKTVDAATVI